MLLSGCGEEHRMTIDPGLQYFPLQTGQYYLYTVDEIRYSGVDEPRVLNYEIMTHIADSFPSSSGLHTYVIHRSRRDAGSQPWEPLDTWSVKRNDREVIVSEGNTAFVKLKFPVAEGASWNGNAQNTLGVDDYAIRDTGKPVEIAGTTFENTITVEQEQNTDVIVFRDERREIYAKDVGLIYKEVVQLHYCTDDNCLGQQKIESGVEMKIAIKEYGKD
jgi:hypothetical protein